MNKKNVLLFLSLIVLLSNISLGQRKISAKIENKQLYKNKTVTSTSEIFYNIDANKIVTHIITPQNAFIITNLLGEMQLYNPDENEVVVKQDLKYNIENELLYYFVNNKIDDFGLKQLNFKLINTRNDKGNIVKTYIPNTVNKKTIVVKVEIAYENFKPIFCAYYKKDNTPVKKIYYNNYTNYGQYNFPLRITEINYISAKDSSISRKIYSDVKVDFQANHSYFDYQVPPTAKKINY